ncbi:TPA: hypothetical protein VAM27_003026 [Acinetobacter baumannii]|uniref:hypothetical protein n=1 Tax=Acinetobacter calcoaceticus/baumannii complex TaxID=909768 RepID=UPI00148ECB01|nr:MULTISPECIES: hypothetical protein [Acinetobacter calcoaceticus/baumannii complex]MCU4334814.1 hypothetical protein [Acinetobacter pittii]HEO1794091.1 hypothetical protein [Acinetobacter baumannii]
MSLSEVMLMGFNFMFEYYKTEAWNENKIVLENNETIRLAVVNRLNSIIKCLNGR